MQRLHASRIHWNVRAHQRAEHVKNAGPTNRRGRIEVALGLSAGPAEVDHGLPRSPVNADIRGNPLVAIHRAFKPPVLEPVDHAPHRLLGVIANMRHVGANRRCAVMRHQRLQFPCSLGVGGQLRLEVGQVSVRIAGRPGPLRQRGPEARFLESTLRHQQEVVEQHALFVDVPAVGRHGARRDPADVGVMGPGGHEKVRCPGVLQEHRRNHRQVGQMCASVIRRIDQVGFAGTRSGFAGIEGRLDAGVHRSEVYRHVRRIGDQLAVRIEQGAGKIQPLLDVDRVRGVLQHRAHLLGNVHEAVVEYFQEHRIRNFADGFDATLARLASKKQVPPGLRRSGPAGRHDRGGVVLGNNRRPLDCLSLAQVPAQVRRRVMRSAAEYRLRREHRPRLVRRIRIAAGLPAIFLAGIAAGLHAHCLHHEFRGGRLNTEAGPVGLGEPPPQIRQPNLRERRRPALRGNRQRVVGVLHANLGHVFEGQVPGLDVRVQEFPAALARQPRKAGPKAIDGARVQLRFQRLLAVCTQGRQSQSQRRQHPRQRVKQHGVHAQLLGDGAGVLTAGPAERAQGELCGVLASLHGNLFDRGSHLVDGDPEEALGHPFDAHAPSAFPEHVLGQFRESRPRCLLVQRLPSVGTENRGKHARLYAPQHEVGVGHGQWTAVAVAGRSGVGARRQGPGEEPSGLIAQDGTAARSHRVDFEHRRPQAHARDFVVGDVLVGACVQGNVGGRPSHVEADQPVMACLPRGAHRAHHAARRPGEDRVLAPEPPGFDQSAVALHERQVARRDPLAPEPGLQSANIAPQHGREVRVDKRGVAAADQFDQGRDFM